MFNLNHIVLSIDKFKELGMYLDVTDFHGVDYNKNESLIKYGFVYDEQTGDLIVTYPDYVWKDKNTPIKFGLTNISKEKISELFNKESDKILSENDMSLETWNNVCESYQINMIETSTGDTELFTTPMTMSVDDLIDYLKTKM